MIKLFGKNLCLSALESNHVINTITISDNIHNKEPLFFEELFRLAKKKSLMVSIQPEETMRRISQGNPHKGCITQVEYIQPKTKELFLDSGAYIYIYHSNNEGNIGAVIRSAELLGFKGVILPLDIRVNETIIRASAGAAFHIKIYNLAIFQAIKLAKQKNFEVVGIERGGSKVSNYNFYTDTVMIIGGEDKELKENILNKCDEIVSIHQKGYTNSFNMSTAAAIVMYNYSVQNP